MLDELDGDVAALRALLTELATWADAPAPSPSPALARLLAGRRPGGSVSPRRVARCTRRRP